MKFCEYVVRWQNKARLKNSEGWRKYQDQIVRDHILPYLKDLELSEIKPENISDIIHASQQKGHKVRQTRKIYMVLSKIFNDAIHFFDYLGKSPVRKLFHLPQIPEEEQPTLTPEQSILFLEYVYGHPLYGLAAFIETLAGPRISEIQALDVKNVNLDGDYILIKRMWDKTTWKFKEYPKGKKQYRVPICPMLKEYLKKFMPKSGLVCRNTKGEMLCYKSYHAFLKRVIGALKLPIKSTHGLRHACATLYAANGASDEDLQKLLGHKWIVSTKTYVHRTDENIFKISRKIS